MSIEEMAKYAIQYSPSFRGGKKPTVESLIKSAQDNEPTSKVGWEGNFTDMALKTVMRRLLSKYGYLSVEMHNAIESDVNSAEASRNDIISDNANKQKINLSEDDYEEVKDDAQQSDSLKLEPEY
jgi:recombination protein RecT